MAPAGRDRFEAEHASSSSACAMSTSNGRVAIPRASASIDAPRDSDSVFAAVRTHCSRCWPRARGPVVMSAATDDTSVGRRELGWLPWHAHGRRARCSTAVTDDRLPHALLVHGPSGVGKDVFAWTLAATLHCRGRGERLRSLRPLRGLRAEPRRLAPGSARASSVRRIARRSRSTRSASCRWRSR